MYKILTIGLVAIFLSNALNQSEAENQKAQSEIRIKVCKEEKCEEISGPNCEKVLQIAKSKGLDVECSSNLTDNAQEFQVIAKATSKQKKEVKNSPKDGKFQDASSKLDDIIKKVGKKKLNVEELKKILNELDNDTELPQDKEKRNDIQFSEDKQSDSAEGKKEGEEKFEDKKKEGNTDDEKFKEKLEELKKLLNEKNLNKNEVIKKVEEIKKIVEESPKK
jgi:asparagine synthetase B (glutamine-hydrolysing)